MRTALAPSTTDAARCVGRWVAEQDYLSPAGARDAAPDLERLQRRGHRRALRADQGRQRLLRQGQPERDARRDATTPAVGEEPEDQKQSARNITNLSCRKKQRKGVRPAAAPRGKFAEHDRHGGGAPYALLVDHREPGRDEHVPSRVEGHGGVRVRIRIAQVHEVARAHEFYARPLTCDDMPREQSVEYEHTEHSGIGYGIGARRPTPAGQRAYRRDQDASYDPKTVGSQALAEL